VAADRRLLSAPWRRWWLATLATLTMKLAFRDQAGRDHMTKSNDQRDSFNKMEDYLRSLLDPDGTVSAR
jgi:hypothetical protein